MSDRHASAAPPGGVHCWYCYQPNDPATGTCQVCGHPVHPPVGIRPADVELWALPHPSSGRRISAVRWLVEHGEPRAVRPLRGLAEGDDTDPVVAAAAARGLSMLRRTSRPHPVRSLGPDRERSTGPRWPGLRAARRS